MSVLRIYNTLNRQKQEFKPITDGEVSMYVCGITVYDDCHIGHARMLVAFDVIYRYLKAQGLRVTYVRNITDIDDKIFRRAKELNEPYDHLTKRYIEVMHRDERSLGVLPPTKEPRATGHMREIVDFISGLVEQGYAYQGEGGGDVYFEVAKFADYGKLSGKVLEDLIDGVRIDVEQAKKSPHDFVLWKRSKPGEAEWPSPWGAGRPGWHIECSAMAVHNLQATIDIHGGGTDLQFPHHENELAQSEACTGETFANIWMHNGALRFNNEKMSKSLGNFFTIGDVLADHAPEVVRYFLVAAHYRSELNYNPESFSQAQASLARLYTAIDKAGVTGEAEALDEYATRQSLLADPWGRKFYGAMDDDFNSAGALAVLFDMARETNKQEDRDQAKALAITLRGLASCLGILQGEPKAFLQGGESVDSAWIEDQIAQRQQARLDKDFALADEIRDRLAAKSIVLEDGRNGCTWRLA